MGELTDMLGDIYNEMEGSDSSISYSERHNIQSAAVLTMTDDETAGLMAEYLAPQIEGKTVVEIGGGIGILALHMGHIAKRVYCIEANPMWSLTFCHLLLREKPKNVSFLFGSADEFVGCIKADVALFLTHSGIESMAMVSAQFAPKVIDVYSEMIAANPDGFDPIARELRKFV